MNKIINFLKLIFGKDKNIYNDSSNSTNIDSNVITGDQNSFIDYSQKTSIHHHYSQPENNLTYSKKVHAIHLLLKSSSLIYLILSILCIFFGMGNTITNIFAVLIIGLILFYSYKIPPENSSRVIFYLNIYTVLSPLVYYYIVSFILKTYLPALYKYILVKEYYNINLKKLNIILTSSQIYYFVFSLTVLFIILNISENSIKQWVIHLKKAYLDLNLILRICIYPLLILFIPILIFLFLNLYGA